MTTAPYIYIWEAVDTGTYIISVVATDNLGATSAYANMTLIVDLVYNSNSEIIDLYPNPNDGYFTVDLVSSLPQNINRLTIVSLEGKTVYNGILNEEESTKEIDLSGSNSGAYILMVTDGQKVVATKKFIKK